MGDLKARLKPLFRRSSTFSSTKSFASGASSTSDPHGDGRSWSKTSLRLSKNRKPSLPIPVFEEKEGPPQLALIHTTEALSGAEPKDLKDTPDTSPETPRSPPLPLPRQNPKLTVQAPTPQSGGVPVDPAKRPGAAAKDLELLGEAPTGAIRGTHRPGIAERRQSLADGSQSRLLSSLVQPHSPFPQPSPSDYFGEAPLPTTMQQKKKIWVKRPGSSATQVMINEDDLVDDVRDMILRKYANSLGRTFDSPDVTLRIIFRHPSGRHSQTECTLGPEEQVSKLLDLYYPGGQAVEEALVIDVPPRPTPRHSPHLALPYYLQDDPSNRPRENGTDYFPPMPLGQQSPHLPTNVSVSSRSGDPHHPNPHSMAILTTGQLPNIPAYVPNLPSPGGRIPRHSQHRPKYGRQHTSSPTVIQGAGNPQNFDNLAFQNASPMPMASPTILEETTPLRKSKDSRETNATTPPAPRQQSPGPRPKPPVNKRSKKAVDQAPHAPGSVRDGAVPPINVLIVEDNIINLRLLEAFMKRLKVRWSTAMNGRDAVTKWREGGFHLVLMDIQMPVMNGLDATKEMRRLERVNSIGVFSNSASSTPTFANGDGMDGGAPQIEDSLMNTALFKSPVIIVALTASSLQSDRHEALAAGCNDFLTKPVNFEWLTRKVMEWGCMQALIDFDGWRKWKDFSQTKPVGAAKPAGGANTTNNKSPKAALNGKAIAPAKKDVEKTPLALGTGKGNTGSDGLSTDTNDSGSGDELGERERGGSRPVGLEGSED